jgi:hypothetical protein
VDEYGDESFQRKYEINKQIFRMITRQAIFVSKMPVFRNVNAFSKKNRQFPRLSYLNPKGKIREINRKLVSFDYKNYEERKMAIFGRRTRKKLVDFNHLGGDDYCSILINGDETGRFIYLLRPLSSQSTHYMRETIWVYDTIKNIRYTSYLPQETSIDANSVKISIILTSLNLGRFRVQHHSPLSKKRTYCLFLQRVKPVSQRLLHRQKSLAKLFKLYQIRANLEPSRNLLPNRD